MSRSIPIAAGNRRIGRPTVLVSAGVGHRLDFTCRTGHHPVEPGLRVKRCEVTGPERILAGTDTAAALGEDRTDAVPQAVAPNLIRSTHEAAASVLASDAASYATGAAVAVGGGFMTGAAPA
jgi:hypothetical protein